MSNSQSWLLVTWRNQIITTNSSGYHWNDKSWISSQLVIHWGVVVLLTGSLPWTEWTEWTEHPVVTERSALLPMGSKLMFGLARACHIGVAHWGKLVPDRRKAEWVWKLTFGQVEVEVEEAGSNIPCSPLDATLCLPALNATLWTSALDAP
jgi:hypothetical protein